jgi:hypothetical protein
MLALTVSFTRLLIGLAAVVGATHSYSHNRRRWPVDRCDLNLSALPTEWRAVVQSAMQEWNAVGASFRFLENGSSTNSVGCFDQGPWGGRLALTQTLPTAPGALLTDARTLVNTHYVWDPLHPREPGRDTSGTYGLETVLRHELGHSLGLAHVRDQSSIMYLPIRPSAPGTPAKPLAQDDKDGVANLYG